MDPFGALATQRKGDTGIFDGTQYQTSGNLGADVAMRITGPGGSMATDVTIPFPSSEGRRLNIFDGSSTHPVTSQAATTFITRYTSALPSTFTDGGALTVNVIGVAAGTGQAVGIQSFIRQDASQDAVAIGDQVVMKNVGGTGYGYFTNMSNVSHTCTITNASPAVVTVAGHGLAANHEIQFTSVGGTLPTGMTAGTRYWVLATSLTANTFRFSASPGGAAINTSSNGTGTFYVYGGAVWGYNPVMINSSNIPLVWNGSDKAAGSAILAQAFGGTLVGNVLRVIDTGIGAAVQWSEGLVFEANTIANQTYLDNSNSAVSIDIAGDHATAGIRITQNNASHYAQEWVRTSATAATWGAIIDSSGDLCIDEPGIARKMVLVPGTPGANLTAMYIQEGAGPTVRRMHTFDPGAAGVNFTAGQLVCVLV